MANLLELNNVNHYFHLNTVHETHVLQDIQLTMKEGEFVTIIGGNGAGKSTLLNSIAGTFPVTSGNILLNQEDITKKNVVQRSQFISRVFQDPKAGTAVRLTVGENLAIAACRGKKRTLSRAKTAKNRSFFIEKLKGLNMGLEEKIDTEIGLLSGGQRQSITLLMATLNKPKLLLLDEHTAALDPKSSHIIMNKTKELIDQQHLTTFMITHNMEDALNYGQRLIMLHQGKIVVDLDETAKKNLTVADLLTLFQEQSGHSIQDDALLLQ
ncbi:ABC transporter ATP-binding protein [Vagococcus humatus]|uniref:ABC transporter ATP-binding protein n=1 Tax=Vagococcus humatus TaxID=1889241 RepID=A0A3S0ACK0_9ENTE|nr:ATP-binding cassette domain-containing protein [Vagococcus humatus]RST88615.1 ABC transporter ATP-binding protein [Vagococcus humatus]